MPEVIIAEGASFEIIKGRDYINWRFQFADEILVKAKDHGNMLIAKLPNGKLIATCNPGIIDSFTKVQPASTFSKYGRTAK